MFRASRLAVSLFLGFAACASSSAHDTWLLVERVTPGPSPSLALLLTTGERYPESGNGSGPEQVSAAAARLAGKTFSAASMQNTEKALRISFSAAGAGVATAWVTLAAEMVELSEQKVEEYFTEVDAPDHVRRAWAAAGPARRWRERYTKHAKVLVPVGKPRADRMLERPVGQQLEIVPRASAGALRVGDHLEVLVLQEGRPLPALMLSCIDAGGAVASKQPTDAAGRAACKLTSPGAWLVRGTEIRRARHPGADWESDWTSLTVPVSQ